MSCKLNEIVQGIMVWIILIYENVYNKLKLTKSYKRT